MYKVYSGTFLTSGRSPISIVTFTFIHAPSLSMVLGRRR